LVKLEEAVKKSNQAVGADKVAVEEDYTEVQITPIMKCPGGRRKRSSRFNRQRMLKVYLDPVHWWRVSAAVLLKRMTRRLKFASFAHHQSYIMPSHFVIIGPATSAHCV